MAGVREAGERARALGRPIRSIGVDGWGVDYGLIDARGQLLEDPVCYRDERTRGVMDAAFARVPREEIFARTGIQFLEFNTIYQLRAHSAAGLPACGPTSAPDPRPRPLLPERPSGHRVHERHDDAAAERADETWDRALLERLALPGSPADRDRPGGTDLGPLRARGRRGDGSPGVRVVAPATHDTGSAVVGAPLQGRMGLHLLRHVVARGRRTARARSSTPRSRATTSATRGCLRHRPLPEERDGSCGSSSRAGRRWQRERARREDTRACSVRSRPSTPRQPDLSRRYPLLQSSEHARRDRGAARGDRPTASTDRPAAVAKIVPGLPGIALRLGPQRSAQGLDAAGPAGGADRRWWQPNHYLNQATATAIGLAGAGGPGRGDGHRQRLGPGDWKRSLRLPGRGASPLGRASESGGVHAAAVANVGLRRTTVRSHRETLSLRGRSLMRVSLFVTCLVDQIWPSIGTSTVQVLRHAGCDVSFDARQTCCGQPAFNTGYRKEAQVLARHWIEIFETAEAVVCPSGSCAAMVHHLPGPLPRRRHLERPGPRRCRAHSRAWLVSGQRPGGRRLRRALRRSGDLARRLSRSSRSRDQERASSSHRPRAGSRARRDGKR